MKQDEPKKKGKLEGKVIAFIATDGFEQSELCDPKTAFEDEGAKCVVVSPKGGKIQGYHHHNKGDRVNVDVTFEDAHVSDFDAIVLPGGVISPDAIRSDPKLHLLIKGSVESNRPVLAICHGPWSLIDADVVRGRRITSWPSLKTDLVNAGAEWVDEEVVVDRGVLTSRKPDDIPEFVKRGIELIQLATGPVAQPQYAHGHI